MEPITAVWGVLVLLLIVITVSLASLLWDRLYRDGNQP